MKLYHPNGKSEVECHPTQVENMKRNGWLEKKPSPKRQPKKHEETEK